MPAPETPRLILQACSPQQILALIEQPERLEALLGVPGAEALRPLYVSDDVSPKWLEALRSAAGADPWLHGFWVIHRERHCVIGAAGFKGAPDAAGMVEIAYGIVPSFEGQGYATEAAGALVTYATEQGARLIRAHTLPVANASTHVLLKNGFRHVDSVVDPEDGPVWRWERLAQP